MNANILKTIEANMIKQSKITGMMAELKDALAEGTAEHFIAWHNSKSRPDRQIPESWYNQYRKERGE